MSDNELIQSMHTAIDDGLRSFIDDKLRESPQQFREMLEYPLGWNGKKTESSGFGKRIRPTLLLLVCHALEEDWRKAIPGAIAVELLHNFTLIHDDIQDRSLTRRGRNTVWVQWGEAQAINAGDALSALAYSACIELRRAYPAEVVLSSVKLLHQTVFQLTVGQHLDIAFEKADEVEIQDYWRMIRGKTGELLSACFIMGAMLSGKKNYELDGFQRLGSKIGLAFQVQDDWLGIWGDQKVIGKSVYSDLLERKKTYPILLALNSLKEFRDHWMEHENFSDKDINCLLEILNKSNINKNTIKQFQQLYDEVIEDFSILFKCGPKTLPLRNAIEGLLKRSN